MHRCLHYMMCVTGEMGDKGSRGPTVRGPKGQQGPPGLPGESILPLKSAHVCVISILIFLCVHSQLKASVNRKCEHNNQKHDLTRLCGCWCWSYHIIINVDHRRHRQSRFLKCHSVCDSVKRPEEYAREKFSFLMCCYC